MKVRLDVLLVNRGLAKSREQAKAIIMEGKVFVKGQREDKAGFHVRRGCAHRNSRTEAALCEPGRSEA